MKLDYKIVSGDSHVDMSWLPGDLFVRNNSQPHLQDMMPRIIDTDEGLIWKAEHDNILGVAQSAGFEFIPPQRGRRKRTDKMLDAGFYDGPARPVDPELRLMDMQTDGVDAEILYGITGSGKNLKNMEVVTEVYRIYNDWVDRFGASNPGRWYGLACLPIHDSKLAAAEVRRVADHPFIRGADLMAGGLNYPLYARDGYWDCLWQACVETGTPISFHIGGGRIPIPTTPTWTPASSSKVVPPARTSRATRPSAAPWACSPWSRSSWESSSAAPARPILTYSSSWASAAQAGSPSPSTAWTTSTTTVSTRRSSTRPSP